MSDFDDELEAALKGSKATSEDDGFADEFNGALAPKDAKGPLEQEWEKNHGASLDSTSAEAMKLLTDGPAFAKSLGGTAARYGLGMATAGPGMLSMLSTILTGSGTGGIAAPAKSAGGFMGALGATGKDVASQGAQGAVAAAADSLNQGDDHETMLKRIMEAGGMGGLAELGATFLSGTAGKLGQGAEWAAQKAKNVVAGSNSREAKAIVDKLGPQADTDMFGKLLDKYSPTGVFSPKSAAGHLEQSVAPQAEIQGQRVGQMLDKAGYDEGVNELVPEAWKGFQGSVDERALSAMRRPVGGEERDLANALANEADAVRGLSAPEDVRGFAGTKSSYQSAGAGKNAIGYAEGARAEANQAVGGIAKDALDDLMKNAEPGTYARWDDARGQKNELEMLKAVLAAKKAGETTAGDIGSTIGSGVVGAGLGALAGGMSGDNAGEGALAGGGLGLASAFGLTGGATKTAIRQLGGTGLADFGANVARATGQGLGTAASFADQLPTGAIGGAASDSLADESRGHQTYEVVEQALKANPRMLGSYGKQLAQSQDLRGDISRLIDDDPQFVRLARNLQAAWK